MYILLALGGAVVLLLLFWPKIRTMLPAAWSGTVTGAIGTASDYTTDALTQAAFTALASAGWANSDLTFLAKLDECRQMQKKWNAPPPAPATITVSAEVAAIQAQVQALTKIVASQAVSVPPTSSAVQP